MVSHGSNLRICHTKWINGKNVSILDTWIQKKCIICKRFLSKRQLKYCSKHSSLNKEYHHNYYLKHKNNSHINNKSGIYKGGESKYENKH